MKYDDLNEIAKKVAYIADQMGHQTGRKVDTASAAATVLFIDCGPDVTAKEVLYVTNEAQSIIDAAENVEGFVEEPEAIKSLQRVS